MSSVEYSTDAVNVLHQFHRCETLVYVEGDDDLLFWEFILSYFGLENFKIEIKDGSQELEKYTERLISEDLNVIIARDADYGVLTGRIPQHSRLLTTFGHSIENTLYCTISIAQLARVWAKVPNCLIAQTESWFEQFNQKFSELICLDIANDHFGASLDVLGDNCTRYMKSKTCDNVDDRKVQQKIDSIRTKLDNEKVTTIEQIIADSDCTISNLIRGHFLQSAVVKYINSRMKELGKNKTISYDNLYSNAIHVLRTVFGDEHSHYTHYQEQVVKLG